MESIIIFVIIAIASSVIQSASQKNKQQKQPANNTQTIRPKMQPAVKTVDKYNASVNSTPVKKTSSSVPKYSSKQAFNMNMEPETVMEGIQTEALQDTVIPEQQKKLAREEDTESLLDVVVSDLQRSIIMAEILGKPKGMQKRRI